MSANEMNTSSSTSLYFEGVGNVPVKGYQKINVVDKAQKVLETWELPIIDSDSDYDWQLSCLKSRMEHPEYYEGSEDVAAAVSRLKQWLKEHNYLKVRKAI